jgi:hypothetical protein
MMPSKKPVPKPVAKPTPLNWDKLNLEWWSSAAGYIQQERNGTWTAFLHRNTRIGKGWTEARKGFKTADKARRWIEKEAED